jgi:raffinose/stachyose/melibiose transport system substrate-binding protein
MFSLNNPVSGRAKLLRLSGVAGLALAMATTSASAQTVVNWLHLEANPTFLAVWEELVADYEAQNPDVDIQMQFLENEAFKAKLPTLLQSNDRPHIFYSWGGGVLEEQAETGVLMNLNEVMDADGGAWRDAYISASLDGLTFDDNLWAVPFRMGTVSFFYNKELFAEAGVEAESIETWDDLLGAVQTLKDAGITPIAGGGGDKWPLHFYWSYLVMRNAGQEVFSDAKTGEGEGFMHPSIIAAGDMLAELGALEPFQDGYLAANWSQAQGAFGDGRAAMILSFENTEAGQRNAAADGVGITADNLGRFPFPAVEGGEGAVTDTLGGLNGWAVTRDAPPEALDFLAYFSGADAERRMAQEGMLIPVAVGAEDGVTDTFMSMAAEQLSNSTWHQNYFDQDLGPNIGRVVNDVAVEIVSGQMTGEEGAQMIQEAFDLEQF